MVIILAIGIIPAVLIMRFGVSIFPPSSTHQDNRPSRTRIVLWFAQVVSILGALAYSIYWESIWDQTSDGLGAVFMIMIVELAAIGGAIFSDLVTSGWRRLVGPLVVILVTGFMIWAPQAEYGIYKTITADRAARIQAAIEQYHTRTSVYPAALNELAPRDLLWVPQPVILRGEGWCYQGGANYYRLGVVYREWFSTPYSVRVYASTGTPSGEDWKCEQRMTELEALYKEIYFSPSGG
ncbi:MAG: hypothetical protein M1281_13425 [Chloroflexi bacterium]|nr:hypothetical protein [Chloroflexota bacterium]